jgi:Arylsulfatase A and related enzymes
MKSKVHKRLCLATLCLSFLATAGFAARSDDPRPNFIFFITDDQLKEMMNFLPEGKGKNLTPATDTLIQSGATVMDRMYVTSPVCTPSRFAALTGTYPKPLQSWRLSLESRTERRSNDRRVEHIHHEGEQSDAPLATQARRLQDRLRWQKPCHRKLQDQETTMGRRSDRPEGRRTAAPQRRDTKTRH